MGKDKATVALGHPNAIDSPRHDASASDSFSWEEVRQGRIRAIERSEDEDEVQEKRPRLMLGCFKPDAPGIEGQESEPNSEDECRRLGVRRMSEGSSVLDDDMETSPLVKTPTGWEGVGRLPGMDGFHPLSERLMVAQDAVSPSPLDGGSTFANNGSDLESGTEESEFLHFFLPATSSNSSQNRVYAPCDNDKLEEDEDGDENVDLNRDSRQGF